MFGKQIPASPVGKQICPETWSCLQVIPSHQLSLEPFRKYHTELHEYIHASRLASGHDVHACVHICSDNIIYTRHMLILEMSYCMNTQTVYLVCAHHVSESDQRVVPAERRALPGGRPPPPRPGRRSRTSRARRGQEGSERRRKRRSRHRATNPNSVGRCG